MKKNTFIKRIVLIAVSCLLMLIGFYAVLIYKDFQITKNEHIEKEEIIIEYEK